MSSSAVVLQLFLTSSRIQRKRAYLTIAAIAWGTVALLLLLAFGEGLRHQMATNMAGMGSGIGVFWPGETTKGWQGLPPGRPIRPRIDDVAMLRERMPELSGVVGEMTAGRRPYGPETRPVIWAADDATDPRGLHGNLWRRPGPAAANT